MFATALKPFGLRSLVGLMKLPAALLTSPVSGPLSSQMRCTIASTAAASRMSTAWVLTVPPYWEARSLAVLSSTAPRRPASVLGSEVLGCAFKHRAAPARKPELGAEREIARRDLPAETGSAPGDEDALTLEEIRLEHEGSFGALYSRLGDLVPEVVKLLGLACVPPRVGRKLLDRDIPRGLAEQRLQRPIHFPDVACLLVAQVGTGRDLHVDEVAAHRQRETSARPLTGGHVLDNHRRSPALLAQDLDRQVGEQRDRPRRELIVGFRCERRIYERHVSWRTARRRCRTTSFPSSPRPG